VIADDAVIAQKTDLTIPQVKQLREQTTRHQ